MEDVHVAAVSVVDESIELPKRASFRSGRDVDIGCYISPRPAKLKGRVGCDMSPWKEEYVVTQCEDNGSLMLYDGELVNS